MLGGPAQVEVGQLGLVAGLVDMAVRGEEGGCRVLQTAFEKLCVGRDEEGEGDGKELRLRGGCGMG